MFNKKPNHRKTASILLSLASITSCGIDTEGESEEEKKDSQTPAAQTASASAGTQTTSTSKAAPTAGETVSVISQALLSSGQTLDQYSLGDGASLRLNNENICDEHGGPANHSLPTGFSGNDDWAAHKTYCILTKDSGTSDTVPGTISTLKMITCFLGEQAKFDGVERPLQLPVTTKCLDQQTVDELHSGGIKNLDFDVLGTDKPTIQPAIWDKQLTLKVTPNSPLAEAMGPDFKIELVFSAVPNQEIAFAARMGNESLGKNEVVAARFDIANGKLRFESMSQRYLAKESNCGEGDEGSNCEGWSRHVRFLAEGKVSSEAEMTKVDHIEALYSEIDNMKDKESSEDDRITFASAIGTEGIGYMTTLQYAVGNPNDINTFIDDTKGRTYDRCYTDKGTTDCKNNGSVHLKAEKDLSFLMQPNHQDFVSGNSWYESASSYLKFGTLEAKAQQ